jgi:hypothetical protein
MLPFLSLHVGLAYLSCGCCFLKRSCDYVLKVVAAVRVCAVMAVMGRIRQCVGGDGGEAVRCVRVVVYCDGERWREGKKGSVDGEGEGEGDGDGGNIEVAPGF